MIYTPKNLKTMLRESNERHAVELGDRRLGINKTIKMLEENFCRKPDDKDGRIEPEEFSLRELWDTFVINEQGYPIEPVSGFMSSQITEAIEPSAFPTITRQLISKKMVDAYNTVDTIADQMVSSFNSKLEVDKIPGFKGTGNPTKRLPGQEYEKISFEEKWYQATYAKYGREVDLTEEAVLFDQTGQILKAAADVGEGAKYYDEYLTLQAIIDASTTSYYPSGVATALYSSDNNNLKASNALADETDITAARTQLRTALKSDDANTRHILMPTNFVLLCPDALVDTAAKILFSQNLAASANRGVNVWGPAMQSTLKRQTTLLSSPILDDNSATTWYFGSPKKQFVKKIVFPFQIVTIKGNEHADILQTIKTRFANQTVAIDTRYFIKCTA